MVALETSRTKEVISAILAAESPQYFARITTGSGLGAMRVLRDSAGLEQAIEYCQKYLEEIKNEPVG